jgi:hypothetical protein
MVFSANQLATKDDMSTRTIGVMAIAVLLALAGCKNQNEQAETTSTPTVVRASAPTQVAEQKSAAKPESSQTPNTVVPPAPGPAQTPAAGQTATEETANLVPKAAEAKPRFVFEGIRAGMTEHEVEHALALQNAQFQEGWSLDHCSYSDKIDFVCYYHRAPIGDLTLAFSKTDGRLILLNSTLDLGSDRQMFAGTWAYYWGTVKDQLGKPNKVRDNPDDMTLKEAKWVLDGGTVTLSALDFNGDYSVTLVLAEGK